MQKKNNSWRPAAFASRSMSETEQGYVHFEKEAVTSIWPCAKFTKYILNMKFLIETDHKPLVPLLGNR